MFERSARRSSSIASGTSNSSDVSFGTDLNRDPVYLAGRVVPSRAFAEAMLTLSEVVKIQKPAQKDNSQYQEWVAGEYLKILQEREPERLSKLEALTERKTALVEKRKPLMEKLQAVRDLTSAKQAAFFKWLLENDRSTWLVLDPIVSVQKDGTFFEAFSRDESIYARVFLPHSAMESSSTPSLGTTNIDFSLLLERELSRVRSYRPLNLQVGLNSVDFKTEAAVVEEEKIPLPDTWVRGLVEVQSVLALAPTVFEMSSDALAEIISRLLAQKEKEGPRALVFRLVPEEPIRVEIEPWGEVYSDDWCSYEGSTTQEIRVWGRRRLSVLKDILVQTDRVTVHLLGSGMPSFWTVVKDGVELTVGLSGWSSNDWASKAKFSSFIPTANIREELLESALAILVKSGQVTTASLSQELSASVAEAGVLLQKLCLQGKAMFDPSRALYRWRDLFPTFDAYETDQKESLESRKGLELFRSGSVTVVSDDLKDKIRYLVGEASIDKVLYKPLLELDADNRPKFAQCSCSHYNFHKLRQGPCRHMIALSLAGDSK
jgi:hypothetical protein